MAQKKTKKNSSTPGVQQPQAKPAEPITQQDVRTMVLHVVELAAAFEGRGIMAEVGEGTPRAARNARKDRALLGKLVRLALAHRKVQRRGQRNVLFTRLVAALTPRLQAYRDRTESEQERERKRRGPDQKMHQAIEATQRRATQRAVRALFLAVFVGPKQVDLDALVPWVAHVREEKSPAEAAKEFLGVVVGKVGRTVHDMQRSAFTPEEARIMHGRWVPRAERARYAQDIHDDVARATEAPLFGCPDLGGISEALGLVIDRCAEGFVRELYLDPRIWAWRLLELLVGRAQEGLGLLPGLEELRPRLLEYADLRGRDPEGAKRAAQDLEAALMPIAERRLAQSRDEIQSLLGALDTFPTSPDGAAPVTPAAEALVVQWRDTRLDGAAGRQRGHRARVRKRPT